MCDRLTNNKSGRLDASQKRHDFYGFNCNKLNKNALIPNKNKFLTIQKDPKHKYVNTSKYLC